jgi:hypothetical protein
MYWLATRVKLLVMASAGELVSDTDLDLAGGSGFGRHPGAAHLSQEMCAIARFNGPDGKGLDAARFV